MAGHSKWANIQHRKGRQDEKRQRIWTRVVREIMVAARTGGGDVSANPRLRLAIEKAKAANMPADTIKRNVDKATGNLEGVSYEEIRYEGYGIGGAAIIVDTMTDNRVRTVAEMRHALSKHGGNLGTDGSVAFQFKHCGQLFFATGTSEDRVMEVALEAGAEDVLTDPEGAIEVLTTPADFEAVKRDVRWNFIKNEIADKFEVKVDYPEVIEKTKDMVRGQFGMYGPGDAQMEEMIERIANGYLTDKSKKDNFMNMFNQVYADKVAAVIVEKVKVEKKAIDVEEFKTIAGA